MMSINEKVKMLEKYEDAYYNKQPLISDSSYDLLKESILRVLPGNHPYRKKIGHAPSLAWPKAKHSIFMGSLNKISNEEDINKWVDEIYKKLNETDVEFVLQHKVDGLSIETRFDNGNLIAGLTRGDGFVGSVVTPNVMNFKGIPRTVSTQKDVFVRGEGIILNNDFNKLQNETKNYFKNARNAAAGITNRISGEQSDFISFIAYDVNANIKKESEKISVLKKLGFSPVTTYICKNKKEILTIYKEYKATKRKIIPYVIDGLVCKVNSIELQNKLGIKDNRPEFAMAFKFDSDAAITTVINILPQVGRTGKITPVGILEPVDLMGSTITKATLHNYALIKELKVGIGSEISLERKGDIIPQIVDVLIEGDSFTRPTKCPSCGGPLEWDDVNLWCKNKKCREREINRILYWITVIDMKGFSRSFVEKLWDTGKIKNVSDLYKLDPDDLVSVSGLGKKTVETFFETLEKTKEMYLEQFIVALGIPGASKGTAEDLVENFKTWDNILKVKVSDIMKIPGYAEISSETVCSGIIEIADMAAELLKVIKIKAKKKGALTNMSFCVTGALESMSRKEFEDFVVAQGGLFKDSVSEGLNYLVTNTPDSGSGKNGKAIVLNNKMDREKTPEKKVKIVTEKEFLKLAKVSPVKNESEKDSKDKSTENTPEFEPLFN